MCAAEHREADEPVLRQILANPFIEGSTLLAVAMNRHVTEDMLRQIRDHPRATYIVEEVNILLSEMRAQQRRARGPGTALDDLNNAMGRMQLSSGPNYARPTYASKARQREIAKRRGSLNRYVSNTSSKMRKGDPSYIPPSSYRAIQGGQSGNLPRNSISMGGYPARGGLSRVQFIEPSASTSHSSAHQPPASLTPRGSYASTPAGNHLRNLDRAGDSEVSHRNSLNPNYRGRGGHHR
jgi:hypothetical protein